jgi:hypothetical protein
MTKEEREILNEIKKQFDKMKKGICSTCGGRFTQKIKIGRCYYTNTCGHRLYQGG